MACTLRNLLWSLVLASPLAACSRAATGAAAIGAAGMSTDAAGMAAAAPAAPCVEPDTGLPSDVFCTGLYHNRDATSYEPDVRPYTPGVTLWSDGAEKQRYLYLPPGATIDTSDMDVWKFPVGTKAFKEFRFNGKLVETRLFRKRDAKTWDSGTYIWDANQQSATLNTSRQPVLLASGYEIPTAKDCDKCHHGGADKLLGLEAVALGLPTARGVTLTQLVTEGSLSNPPAATTIALPEDATGLAGAALGYLHANCGMPCHSTRGLGHETELVLRLRAGEFWPAADGGAAATDSYRATVGQQAVTGAVTAAFPDALRITPGAHDRSLVWLLAHRRGDYQMPPLVSHQIDEAGTQELAVWIDAMAAP